MPRRKWMTSLVVALFVISGALAAHAGGEKKINLMAAKDGKGASGSVAVKDGDLTIAARGLKPNSVYTVWFVNMKPEMKKAGVGTAPYDFKSDAKGNATFKAKVDEAELGKWQVLMIVRHPTGDPTKMEPMEDWLAAKLM